MLQIPSANAEGSSCSFVTAELKRCQNIFWINSYFKIEVRVCEILMQGRRQVLNCCNYDTAAKNEEKKTKREHLNVEYTLLQWLVVLVLLQVQRIAFFV